MKVSEALKGVRQLALDTASLIYFVEKHPDYYPLMQAIVDKVDTGDLVATGSTLVLAEVLVQPFRVGNTDLAQKYEGILSGSRSFGLLPVSSTVARQAATIRATYNLRLPDALHAATALVSSSDAFLTNDVTFRRVSELSVILLSDLEFDN